MWVHNPRDPLEPSRYTGEIIFMLNCKGKSIEIVLRKVYSENSEKLTDNPFNIVWILDRITPQSLEELTYEEIIELLKEALSVYGTDGIETRAPFENIVVTCKF